MVARTCEHTAAAGRQYPSYRSRFSRRASPLPFLGPQRRTPPALSVDQLHQLDAVVISHNHYDHLDELTVRHILKRFPDVSVFVPLGTAGWFRRRGAKQVVELDWWQSFTAGDNIIRRTGAALEYAHALEPQSLIVVRLGL